MTDKHRKCQHGNKVIYCHHEKNLQPYLAQCIQQTVVAGISESLNGKNEIVSQLVHDVLNIKVDSNGRISSYARDNDQTLLEYHVKHAIREIAKEELANIVESSRPRISEAIRAEFSKKEFMENTVESFTKALIENLTRGWRSNISVRFSEVDE